MGMRFRRTMKIAPGVRVNLGKRGVSMTVGGGLGRVTVGSSGTHVGTSIPGTGIYFSQKVGATSAAPRSAESPRAAAPRYQVGTVESLLRTLPPREPGTSGLFAMLTRSPKRTALKSIEAAAAAGAEATAQVDAAVASASDSWTVRREAGLFYKAQGKPDIALAHLAEAARLFPGDRRLYLLVAASAASDAGDFSWVRQALEPYLPGVDPESDIDALIVSSVALAQHRSGDSARALELLGRLPLRRRNLSDTLLFALCVRACANRAVGKKAQAKKDLDRVYAYRPDFHMLAEASAEVLA